MKRRGIQTSHLSLTTVLILLYFPSYTESSNTSGAIAASQTIERFCKNNLLYSGNGRDLGDTAQYDNKATPITANVSFCIESKVILDSAPTIRS